MVPDAPRPAVEYVLALKTVTPFSALPPDDLALLVDRTTPRTFAVGAPVLEPGVPVSTVHLLLEGRVTEQRGGRPWATRAPYEVLGGVDAIAHAGEDLVAIAEAPTRTLELAREDLLDVCLDRFAVLATVASGVAAMALAARRRLGRDAGFASAPADHATGRDGLGLAERLTFLRDLPALGDTRLRTLAQVAAAMREETIVDGEVLWRAGTPADHLVVVESGLVRCVSGDGTQRFALGRGEAAGVLDGLAGEPRWYDATADGAVRTLRISIADLLDLLEDDPEAAVQALESLARATSALVGRVVRRAVAAPPK
jgi:signal-transduction protein with cAMP-binding, CBS, and nucleotidyltransferase domain